MVEGRSLDEFDDAPDELAQDQPALASCYGAAVGDRQLLGADPGQRTQKHVEVDEPALAWMTALSLRELAGPDQPPRLGGWILQLKVEAVVKVWSSPRVSVNDAAPASSARVLLAGAASSPASEFFDVQPEESAAKQAAARRSERTTNIERSGLYMKWLSKPTISSSFGAGSSVPDISWASVACFERAFVISSMVRVCESDP
ncbi:hypothetical protein G6O69_09255 [Pseudenhygromyxa sp. WMMC2535]|uniref:hypothetical protein n=1 Tax=Pseudenhygromyxa sp. WMMC2535 TaxID=2712867 RepID=UPI00155288EA|nr:hypothetical protein [Pseudenhygromyxa sp. WMMC2535]NVB38018.1 hypothetical protein [Pseudenhygromyxa sp. WMMC2535]